MSTTHPQTEAGGTPRPYVDALVEDALGRALTIARKRLLTELAKPSFLARCRARYAAGQAEYGYAYAWLDWPAERFTQEIGEEMADLCVYVAMELAAGPGCHLERLGQDQSDHESIGAGTRPARMVNP